MDDGQFPRIVNFQAVSVKWPIGPPLLDDKRQGRVLTHGTA